MADDKIRELGRLLIDEAKLPVRDPLSDIRYTETSWIEMKIR